MVKICFISIACAGVLFAQTISKEAFFEAVEKNSINLIKNKSQFESLLEEQRATNAWDSPYAEIESNQAKNAQGRNELETTALFMLKPKLPWVQTLLTKSLRLQSEQYQKTYELYKNLAFIAAKRIYFTYVLTKEKYEIYIQREENFLSQLKIAKAKVKAGSMSQKDYISFNNSYLDAKLLKMQAQGELFELQKTLHQLLGLQEVYTNEVDEEITAYSRDIVVPKLDFAYSDITTGLIKTMLDKSLYTQIIDLQSRNYQNNAKIANRGRFDALEMGAGVTHAESSNGVAFRFSVPLPVTTKNTHLKRKFLALQSGSLREGEITKTNLNISADSYLDQLHNKRNYIELQKANIENKKNLVDMGKIAYEAQKISLFEYLTYQNAYMDSLITLANAKLEYVNIQSMLEETLGILLGEKQ